jgi:hypothetical protein
MFTERPKPMLTSMHYRVLELCSLLKSVSMKIFINSGRKNQGKPNLKLMKEKKKLLLLMRKLKLTLNLLDLQQSKTSSRMKLLTPFSS